MKHTPGPWVLEERESIKVVFSGEPREGFNRQSPCILMDGYLPEREANGRLIAAAPDLLAALKRFCEVAPNVEMPFASYDALPISEALAAIRKAEGRA